jgi:hypothetical protein
MDISNLYQFDQVPRQPYVQPRYWPACPMQAPTFYPYITSAYVHRPFTTLDTYVAPLGNRAIDAGAGVTKAIPGNTYVLWGNAPTDGVYTGVQRE